MKLFSINIAGKLLSFCCTVYELPVPLKIIVVKGLKDYSLGSGC